MILKQICRQERLRKSERCLVLAGSNAQRFAKVAMQMALVVETTAGRRFGNWHSVFRDERSASKGTSYVRAHRKGLARLLEKA